MLHQLALIQERHPATSRQFCLLLLIQYVKDHFALADIGNEQTVVRRGFPVLGTPRIYKFFIYKFLILNLGRPKPPERRCSSRTFRYGYLVTT